MNKIEKRALRTIETSTRSPIMMATGEAGTFAYTRKISGVNVKDIGLTFNGQGMVITGVACDGTTFSCPGGNIDIHEGGDKVDVLSPVAYVSP